MAGWGLVGSATANAPLNTLEEIIAAQAMKDEAMRKQAIEQRKLGQDDARISIDAQRAGYEGQRVGLDRDKFVDTQSVRTKEQQDFDNLIEEASKSQPWMVPVLKARRIAGVSVNTRDAAMSPEAQHAQELTDDTSKSAAEAAARAAEQRTLHGYRLSEQAAQDASAMARAQVSANRTATPKPANGEQRKTLDYFTRMVQAEKDARDVEEKVGGWDLNAIEHAPESALNYISSAEGQKYLQAMRAWSLAKLRKESGAAINKDEYSGERRTFFRQPGEKDADNLLKQRRAQRLGILRGLAGESGSAFSDFYGDKTVDDILRDFEEKQPSSGPKVGERRQSGGETREWTGSEWKLIKDFK